MPSSAWFRALPKVELHCHIEGAMRASTVAELAAGNGIELPTNDVTSLFDYEDLTGFLNVFWLVQSVLQTPDDWERLAYESIIDGVEHGLRHREAFFTPARHLAGGQQLDEIIAGLDRGLAAAERETGATCTLIFDIDRDFGPERAKEHVAELVVLKRSAASGSERVIGVGMDSTELGIDPLSFAEAYAMAPSAGLRRTAHQGENSAASAIVDAVDGLGCERIDHGISIFEDPELVKRFADERIPLTVCPNANVRINPGVVAELGAHVYPAMRAEGLLATLNTDDPALVGLDLTQEYELCAETFGYDEADMVDIALDGVAGSWLESADAEKIRSEILAVSSQPADSPSAD